MPALDTAPPSQHAGDSLHAPLARHSAASYIATLIQEFRRALAATQCYEDLDRKSDAELAAMGLTRADVAREVARRHFEG